MAPKIGSIYDFTDKALVELKAWLEPWLLDRNARGRIDSTENVGTTNGVQSIEDDGDLEAEGLVLTADGLGGSTWSEVDTTPRTFSEVVLDEGTHLVAYWKMDAASGAQPDYSANPLGDKPLSYHAGTNTGVYDVTGALPVGQDDGAFRFNYNQNIDDGDSGGTQRGSYFNASDGVNNRWAFAGLAPFSVEFWLKPKSGWSIPAATQCGIVGCSTSNSGSILIDGWQFTIASDFKVVMFRSNSAGTGNQATSAALSVDVWHHVVGTYDGTTMRLYVDGVLSASSASSVSLPTNTSVIVGRLIGGAADVARYVYGDLDEIAVFDAALSATVVAEHYYAGLGSFSTFPNGPAGGVLEGSYPNPGLAASVAGAGLAETSDVLSVNVDGSTLEISSDTLRVKDAGITEAKIGLSDNTTDDVTSTKHGLAPKAPADATKFLNGAATPAYAQVKDSDLSTSDVTTNNVGTSKHGFAPKAPNDTSKFFRGDASWAAPTVAAANASIADAGGYFTGTDVEAALQELGAGTGATGADYSLVILRDGPVALWLLDDSAAPFADYVSNHPGTMSGTVGTAGAALIDGLARSAQFTPSNSSLITVADSTALSPLSYGMLQMTVEIVFNLSSLPATTAYLIGKASNPYEWALSINSAGTAGATVWTTAGNAIYTALTGTGAISTGTTYHLAMTVDFSIASTSGIKFFLNGVDVTTSPTYGSGGTVYSNTASAVVLGRRGDASGNFVTGRMQAAAIHPKALSATRLLARVPYLI